MRDRDALLLHDFLAFCAEAIELARHRNRSDMDTDLALNRALTYLVQVVGEAANGLSPQFRSAHPDVAWPEIIGMRNRIVHEYWRVDADVVWGVVGQDLPRLVQLLSRSGESGGGARGD